MHGSGEDTVQAFCYLYRADDERNKCLLTGKNLIVIHKGDRQVFELQQVKGIEFNTRRLMLPLLAGGIFAPLSAVAIFEELYDPWGLLLILFTSLFLFYYGWLGQTVLTVMETPRHRDFSIPAISPNIRAFAGFVNDFLSEKHRNGLHVYHITEHRLWTIVAGSGHYKPHSLEKEGFIHCYARGQVQEVIQSNFREEKELLLLVIDPLMVKSEIRYEDVDGNGRLYPLIYGPLNTDAVIKTIPFRSEEIQSLLTSG